MCLQWQHYQNLGEGEASASAALYCRAPWQGPSCQGRGGGAGHIQASVTCRKLSWPAEEEPGCRGYKVQGG